MSNDESSTKIWVDLEEKYAALFHANTNPMSLTRVDDGRFVEVNEAFLQTSGYQREEVIGKTAHILGLFLKPQAREVVLNMIQEGQNPAPLETDIRTKCGEIRHGRFRVHMLELANGSFLLSTMQDVTDQRRAEEALKESEHRYRMVSELTSDYSYAYRVEPDGELINEWVTGAFKKITGYLRDELKARGGWESLIFPDDIDTALGQLKQLLAGEAAVVEYRVVTRTGEQRWMRDHARPELDAEGRVTHLYGAVQDITDERRAVEERLGLESKIQQAQKLESLGVLAGGIAHDFNNLLVGILGNADLALMDLAPEAPARGSIEDILIASKRAAELVRQLLAYSGKGRFVVQALDLRTLVEEMAHLLEVSISKKAMLKFDLGAELEPIEADATQIRQIVMNLITNASEAIGDHSGAITLRVGTITCGDSYLAQTIHDEGITEGRYSFVEVSDTGVGMDEQTRAKIFDPFFTTKFTGRGLGLAAVLGIVRGHQGALKVYSVPGQGTSIKILFPAATGALPRDRGADLARTALFAGKTVLLVDDEETVRQVGSRMLQRLGFNVLSADDGEEALATFREQQGSVDLVLLDLTMPNVDGEECFRELRLIRPDVRVVVTSGYSEQDLAERFAGKGLAGVIQKPFRVQALATVLAEALTRELQDQ
jgi:two-component system cell cycle sensor histidine kinase/response regulator CckA